MVNLHTSTRWDRVPGAVTDACDRAQTVIVAVATSTVGTSGQLGARLVRPDAVEVTFGLTFHRQGQRDHGRSLGRGHVGGVGLEITDPLPVLMAPPSTGTLDAHRRYDRALWRLFLPAAVSAAPAGKKVAACDAPLMCPGADRA